MVDGVTDAPKDTPMITECTKIPSSRTCMVRNLCVYFKRNCLVHKNIYLVGERCSKEVGSWTRKENFVLKHRLSDPLKREACELQLTYLT